jgi:tripartite-type tricarboxylate transporter receptor subunit TctC
VHAILIVLRTLLLSGACLASGLVCSQTFPSRPVTMVVPWPAGGAADFVARTLGKEMERILGQPVIVDNVPGAGGSLGAAKALRAPADGYTLMISSPLDILLAPLNFPAAGYKPEDARAVALVGRTDLMLVTRKDLAADSLTDLVAMMKANPGKPLSTCIMGSAAPHSLLGERISTLAGVQWLEVPYSGLGDCVRDIIGGQVDTALVPISGPFPGFVDNGHLKALAALGDAVHPRLPTLPLARETRGFEGLSMSLWAGLHVHARVPEAIVRQLHQATYAALAKPELGKAIANTGGTVSGPMSLDQVQAAYLKEVKLYRTMARPAATVRP